MSKPLDGLRVIDFSRQMAGPYAGVVLADFGADVVKVETLPHGDPSRRTGVALVGDQSAFFLMWNRGKRSIALDMRRPEGLEIVQELIAGADVVLENYRPGVADEIGIGYEQMSRRNPRLIHCSVSGFGPVGPMRTYPATDPIIQGMSGLMSMTGDPDGAPALVGIPIADFTGAVLAAQGILLAVISRGTTGKGQKVDTALLFGVLSALQPRLATFWATGEEPGRHGSAHNQVVPYQAFQTADGWAMAGIWGDGDWPRFCEAVGLTDLVADARFATSTDRLANKADLAGLLEPPFLTRTTDDWAERFREAGALFGPVLTVSQIFDHPQVAAAGIVRSVDHPTLGPIPQFGPPVWLSDTPGGVSLPPPLLGQHTAEILSGIGYPTDRITALEESGVVRVYRGRG